MGLFSSKKKTYSSATISRMIEDKDIKDLNHTAILDYTLGNNDRVDALSTSFNDIYNLHVARSLGANAIRISNWARKQYYYGVANGYRINKGKMDLRAIAQDFLIKLLGEAPLVNVAKLGPLNNSHTVFQILQDSFNYSYESNTLTVDGVVYYLDKFVVNYCSGTIEGIENLSFLDPLGLPDTFGYTPLRPELSSRKPTEWVQDANASEDYAVIHLLRIVDGKAETTTMRVNFLAYEWSGVIPDEGDEVPDEDEPDYFMVQYTLNDVRKTLTLRYKTGDNPELDRAILTDVDPGKYLPNLYVYRNGRAENHKSLRDTEAFKSSRKLCNELRLDYDEFVNNVYDGIKHEPTVDACYMTFRLAVNDFKDPIVQEYMYNLFYEMFKDSDGSVRSDYEEEYKNQLGVQARSGISISLGDKVSNTNLRYNNIGCELKSGKIAEVGKCTGHYTEHSYGLPKRFAGNILGKLLKVKVHTFRKQLTETTYREITVSGLNVSYGVNGGPTVNASGTDENLIIPIDIDVIVKRMSRYRHELISKAMHLVVTTKKTVKKKWYQTGVFKVILFIVAIVITVVFPPASIAAYPALVVGYAIAVNVVISIAITLVSKLLYRLGLRSGVVMAIIAVIAIIIGGFASIKDVSVGGLNSTQILAISNNAFRIGTNLNALQMEARYKSYLDYTAGINQQLEELEQKKKDLGLDLYTDYDMFELMAQSVYKPDIRLGESALSFLNRVSAGTDFVETYLQIVPNYPFIATQLPTLEDNLRGLNSYGV